MNPADMLAEARWLVLAAGRHPEARDRALGLSSVGLAHQIRNAERNYRATMAWVAERETRGAPR